MLHHLIAKPLPSETAAALIKEATAVFSRLPGLTELWLFGSAAQGSMRESSDLDLALIFRSVAAARAGYSLAQKARRESALLRAWPLDLLCADRETFAARAAVGGVYLVVKDEGTRLFSAEESQ